MHQTEHIKSRNSHHSFTKSSHFKISLMYYSSLRVIWVIVDWLGRVSCPISPLAALCDAHVKDMVWAIYGFSWSPTQEVTSDTKFTEFKVSIWSQYNEWCGDNGHKSLAGKSVAHDGILIRSGHLGVRQCQEGYMPSKSWQNLLWKSQFNAFKWIASACNW